MSDGVRVEWSEPFEQILLALVREAEPLVELGLAILSGRRTTRCREVVLWCDHPSARGTGTGPLWWLWECDACGAFYATAPLRWEGV